MSVPTNLIPTRVTQLPEYTGSSTLGYVPYVLGGVTYKVLFANIAAVGAVPSTRVIASGTGLSGGGNLSADRTISITPGGVDYTELALSGVVAGTYGSGANVPVLTVDDKGRVTSATTASLTVTGFVPTSRTVATGNGLIGGGSLSSNLVLSANYYALAPESLGTASAGASNAIARGDHVHPAVDLSSASQTQGALPLGRGGTGDALSPAAGAVAYSTGSKFALSSIGTSGQVLVSNGASAPGWLTLTGTGTVNSIDVSGGTTGLTTSGGPITAAGTITIAGTLGVASGGTGATTAATARTALGATAVGDAVFVAVDALAARTAIGAGTVNSVGGSGAVNGITLTGDVTSSGALALGGTLAGIANDQLVNSGVTVNGAFTSLGGSVSVGTVTSVAALTIGTAGTDLASSVATGTTAPVITLNVPTASAANRGALSAADWVAFNSKTTNTGTVTSVAGSGTVNGLSLSGTVTTAGSLTLGGTLSGVSLTTQVSGTLPIANGGTGGTTADAARTNLGGTTLGSNLLTIANPSAVTFPRFNADNTASSLDAAAFRTAIGAGTSSNTGTVTSVAGSGTVNGITLTGTVTASGSLTLGGTLSGVSLTTQVSGTLPIASGGNGGTAVPTAGAVAHGNGTAYAFTAAGLAGQILVSTGSTAPVFGGINGGTF